MSGKRTLKPVDLDLDEPGKDMSGLFTASLAGGRVDTTQATMIPIERLLDNPYQPRSRVDTEALEELAEVIRGQGFQGVLHARPHPEQRGYYQLTAGHRRRDASRRIGLPSLPIVVRDLADEEMVFLAITENIQREDLTPLEEGKIYLLMQEEMGYTLEQIAREVGKKLGYIYNRVRVAKAPPDIQALVEQKPDSLRAVANLIKIESIEDRARIIDALFKGAITTDDIPAYHHQLQEERAAPTLTLPVDAHEQDPHESVGNDPGLTSPHIPLHIPSVPANLPSPSSLPDFEATQSAGETEEMAGQDTILVDGIEMTIERAGSTRPRSGTTASRDWLEARARQRARRTKLSRISALLQSYADGVDASTELSMEEKLDLATISLVVRKLFTVLQLPQEADRMFGEEES